MDAFEKQQTIETIQAIVKARWFLVILLLAQGLVLNFIIFTKGEIELASSPILSIVAAFVLLLNLFYWLYLRRPIEKISEFGLKTVKILQAVVDQLAVSAVIFFSGTTASMQIVMYFIFMMVVIVSLYRRTGAIITMLLNVFLFCGLVVLEYKGIMHPPPGQGMSSSFFGRSMAGDKLWLMGSSVGFSAYAITAAIFASFLANLFRKREKKLVIQRDELVNKTKTLTYQTQELTQTKDQLQSSLTKSDITRKAADQARNESEKANLELKKKIDELEKFYKVTVGREVRMAEMKKRIKELEDKVKKREGNKS